MPNQKVSEDSEITSPQNNDFLLAYRGSDNYRINWSNLGYLQKNLTNLVSTGAFVNAAEYDTINDAYNALPSSGGTIFMPPGSYSLTSAISTSQLQLIGCGRRNTVIEVDAEMTDAFTFATDPGNHTWFYMEGFTIDGNDKATNIIKLLDDFAILRDIDLTECKYSGSDACIYNNEGSTHIFDGVICNAATYGIYSYDDLTNTWIDRFRSNTCTIPINIDHHSGTAPEGVRITRALTFSASGNSIQAKDTNFFTVDKCILDGTTRGIYLLGGNIRTKITNNYIDCNQGSTSDDNGIEVEGDAGGGLVIANNTILNGYYGIRIKADASNSATKGHIKDNDITLSSASGADISLDSTADYVVTGNQCTNTTKSILEIATKQACANEVHHNFLASSPTKSASSRWFSNKGDLAWTSWTPTWANLTIGNATVEAKYKIVDNKVKCRLSVVFGSTTAVSGNPIFSLPVTAVDYPGASDNHNPIGIAHFLDSGTTMYGGDVSIYSTAQAILRNGDTSGNQLQYLTNISSSVPMTWTTSDEISCEFEYEKA